MGDAPAILKAHDDPLCLKNLFLARERNGNKNPFPDGQRQARLEKGAAGARYIPQPRLTHLISSLIAYRWPVTGKTQGAAS